MAEYNKERILNYSLFVVLIVYFVCVCIYNGGIG